MPAGRLSLATVLFTSTAMLFAGCSTTPPIAEAEWVEIDPMPRDQAGPQNFVVLAAGDGAGFEVYEQYLALQVRERINALAEASVDHPLP